MASNASIKIFKILNFEKLGFFDQRIQFLTKFRKRFSVEKNFKPYDCKGFVKGFVIGVYLDKAGAVFLLIYVIVKCDTDIGWC